MADDADNQNTNDHIEEHEDLFDSAPEDADNGAQDDAGSMPDGGESEDGKAEPADGGDKPQGDQLEGEEDSAAKSEDDTQGDPENPDKPKADDDPKEKARSDYAERQSRKTVQDYVSAVEREEKQKQSELDPEDPNYRIEKLESENRIRDAEAAATRVEQNIQQLANEEQVVAQTIPMFRPLNEDGTPNPEFNEAAFQAAEAEFARNYATFSDAEKAEDRIFLGAYDPRTGQPVSYANFMKKKAEEYATIAGTSAQKAAQETRTAERKMRGKSDPVGGSGAPKKESAEDREAREMAEAFGR